MWALNLQYFVAKLIYILSNGLLQAMGRILYVYKSAADPQNILIFRTGNLGDTFCAVPAIKALQKRFPNSRFIFMTAEAKRGLPQSIEVLRGIVEFDKTIIYNPGYTKNRKYLLGLLTRIRKEEPDIVIYMGQSDARFSRFIRDMLFFKMASCRSACGFRLTKHRLFRNAQRHYRNFDNEVSRIMKLLSPLNVDPKISWEIPKMHLNLLWPRDLDSRVVVSIHPTTKFTVNRWPVERFVETAQALSDKYRAFIVIIGDLEAGRVGELLKKKLGNDVLDLAGKTSFLELAGILKHSDLLISNDSGPVHVAAAVGTPVVGIYTARDFPQCWYPWGDQHRILRKDVSCQMCMKTECETKECLRTITTKEVLSACDEILSKNKN